MTIPLDQGFTVVTGPNGSGKSNILDGILFCLGLASSRGMRADRLPDLVNSTRLKQGKAAETVVSVRFDLSDWQPDEAEAGLEPPDEGPWIQPGQSEWTVTRRLRIAPGGTYASSYSADGVACNLQQLQTQLRRPAHRSGRGGRGSSSRRCGSHRPASPRCCLRGRPAGAAAGSAAAAGCRARHRR